MSRYVIDKTGLGENIELVKRLASIKDKNFKVEDWGPNKVHTYFMGFVPTKKQY